MPSILKSVKLDSSVYHSPRWSTEITDCGVPMSFDQYSRCYYNCLYCFSAYQKAVSSRIYTGNTIMAASPKDISRLWKGDPKMPKSLGQFRKFVEAGRVMQWGGLADPFCEFERKFGVGLKVLRLLAEYDHPVTFSTKGTWWTKDPRYVELFRGQRNWNVKFSIITMDEDKRKIIEDRCPSTRARLKAMERVASWDCGGATLRLRPFIIGVSSPRHVELIHAAADHGATAVSTEFFCVEERSTQLRERLIVMSNIVGYDMHEFYRKYSYGVGYLRLNRNVKRGFVDEMQEATHERDMRFYVSDAHFKERCDNGCCCGLPNDWNYFRSQNNEALQIAQRKGKVRWRDIVKCGHLDFSKDFEFRFTHGFNTRSSEYRARFWGKSLYEWLRWQWNHPDESAISPYKMFEGILKPCGVDKQGNVIYRYDDRRA